MRLSQNSNKGRVHSSSTFRLPGMFEVYRDILGLSGDLLANSSASMSCEASQALVLRGWDRSCRVLVLGIAVCGTLQDKAKEKARLNH